MKGQLPPLNGVESGFSIHHTVLDISSLSESLILIFYIPRRSHPSVDIFSITWATAIDSAIVYLSLDLQVAILSLLVILHIFDFMH